MRNSKLFYFLNQLNSKSRKEFHDFLLSPYFNKKKEPVLLFEVLNKRLLSKKSGELSDEKGHALVFPGEAYNANSFRKLKTALLDLLLQYFAHTALKNAPDRMNLTLLKHVGDLKADHYFDFLYKKASKSLSPDHLDYLELAYQLELERTYYLNRTTGRTPESNLTEVINLLDQSYALRKLNLGFNARNLAFLYGNQLEIKGMPELLAAVEQDLASRPVIVQMVYRRYMTIVEREELEHYHDLKRLLSAHAHEIHPGLAKDLYTGALNFCIYRINKGTPDFLAELLSVYKAMLKAGFLLVDGYFPHSHFKNMVAAGARLGEYEWTKGFLNTYGPLLEQSGHASALAYNQAVLDYFQQEYELAERGFHQVMGDIKDIHYGVDARVYLLRIYYETENPVGMDSLCHSFRLFLDRSAKLSQSKKDNYYTFIKFYRRLMNVPPGDVKRLERLRQDVVESVRIAPYDWLLEKIDAYLEAIPKRYRS